MDAVTTRSATSKSAANQFIARCSQPAVSCRPHRGHRQWQIDGGDLFVARGVTLIDTDVIAREVVEPGRPALAQVLEAFGHATILGPDGRLDRRAPARAHLQRPVPRRTLESILHPAIREEMEHQSAAPQAGPYQILAIPLLAEGGRRDHVDRVLVVDAPDALRVQR